MPKKDDDEVYRLIGKSPKEKVSEFIHNAIMGAQSNTRLALEGYGAIPTASTEERYPGATMRAGHSDYERYRMEHPINAIGPGGNQRTGGPLGPVLDFLGDPTSAEMGVSRAMGPLIGRPGMFGDMGKRAKQLAEEWKAMGLKDMGINEAFDYLRASKRIEDLPRAEELLERWKGMEGMKSKTLEDARQYIEDLDFDISGADRMGQELGTWTGENIPPVRQDVGAGLDYLGPERRGIDPALLRQRESRPGMGRRAEDIGNPYRFPEPYRGIDAPEFIGTERRSIPGEGPQYIPGVAPPIMGEPPPNMAAGIRQQPTLPSRKTTADPGVWMGNFLQETGDWEEASKRMAGIMKKQGWNKQEAVDKMGELFSHENPRIGSYINKYWED